MKRAERLPWPVNEAGEPENAEFLCNIMPLDMKDEITMNLLEAYGIPCICTYPGDGAFAKVIMGMSGEGTNILVPSSMLGEAKALIEAVPVEDEEDRPG